MNTDARRKASATYHAKRAAAGLRKVTVWITPETQAQLDALGWFGSKDKIVATALARMTLAFENPPPPPV